MNVAEITETVAERADVPRTTARRVLDAVFESIEEALRNGQEVRLGSIGKLHMTVRAASTLNFGEKKKVPAKKVVRFKAFAGLKQRLNPA